MKYSDRIAYPFTGNVKALVQVLSNEAVDCSHFNKIFSILADLYKF